jgi:predicted nucleic acid-binding protein
LNDYRPAYLDSSALVKLLAPEIESAALRDWLRDWPDRFTSVLTHVEVMRALRRTRMPTSAFSQADAMLQSLDLIHLVGGVLELAAKLKDPVLRSLEAIHLACALSIGDLPEAFVTYDTRLASAAKRLKIPVAAPGT